MAAPRRRRWLLGVAVFAAVMLMAGGVRALTNLGSREISQSTAGVAGSAENGDYFAVNVAVGNFDGDRFADVVAAAPYEDRGVSRKDSGVIQVLYGSRTGVSTSGDAVIHQGSPNVVGPSLAGDQFGSALAVGDFDGDGIDDLVVGVAGRDIGEAVDAGEIVVLYGGNQGLSGVGSARFGQDSDGVDGDPQSGDFFGHSLTSGDFDGDGYDDVAVGAPGDLDSGFEWGGSVTVLYGTELGLGTEGSMLVHQGVPEAGDDAEPGDKFGWALDSGDFNGDERDDLAVGVPGESIGEIASAGIVQVFNGSETGITIEANALFSEATPGLLDTPEPHDRFGSSLAAGDFDSNGASDLAVGVPGETRLRKPAAGAVQVLEGTPSVGLQGIGSVRLSQSKKVIPGKPGAADEFGFSLTAGDFNGNGRDDLSVGVPGEKIETLVGAGTTHVFFGRPTGIDTLRNEQWRPGLRGLPGLPQANAGVGRSLAAGDINGDGRDDLIIGTPGRTVANKGAAGSFTVIYG